MLSDEDEAILDMESRWFRQAGAKVQAVRAELGLTETRYYQRLNAILDDPAAVGYAPMVVNRLRRLRATRARRRRAA